MERGDGCGRWGCLGLACALIFHCWLPFTLSLTAHPQFEEVGRARGGTAVLVSVLDRLCLTSRQTEAVAAPRTVCPPSGLNLGTRSPGAAAREEGGGQGHQHGGMAGRGQLTKTTGNTGQLWKELGALSIQLGTAAKTTEVEERRGGQTVRKSS